MAITVTWARSSGLRRLVSGAVMTFQIVLAFVIVSSMSALLIGWCIPIGRFVGEHIAPMMGVLAPFAWRQRSSWFLLLFAGLGMQAIVVAAVAYRMDVTALDAAFRRSPILFTATVVAIAATLLMFWVGVPVRAALRRRLSGSGAPLAIALGVPFGLLAASVVGVCATFLPA